MNNTFTTISKDEEVTDVLDIICNKCEKSCYSEIGNAEGLIEYKAKGSYNSKEELRENTLTFSWCETCLLSLFKKFKAIDIEHVLHFQGVDMALLTAAQSEERTAFEQYKKEAREKTKEYEANAERDGKDYPIVGYESTKIEREIYLQIMDKFLSKDTKDDMAKYIAKLEEKIKSKE